LGGSKSLADNVGENEIAALKSTTKADIINFFAKSIHPSSTTRSKLSTHLVSTYSDTKFDVAAAEPLMGAFVQHGIEVDQGAIATLLASKPDLKQVRDYALGLVGKAPIGDEAKTEIKAMINDMKGAESAPVQEGQSEGAAVRSSNVYIENLDTFKAGLIPSRAAMPVQPLTALAKL
jgi:insulysin